VCRLNDNEAERCLAGGASQLLEQRDDRSLLGATERHDSRAPVPGTAGQCRGPGLSSRVHLGAKDVADRESVREDRSGIDAPESVADGSDIHFFSIEGWVSGFVLFEWNE
jgi:hypothetical protein